MKKIIKCPDCNGNGGEIAVDIEDYVECPTCEGTGEVEEGTKSWIQRLLESKM